MGGGATRSCTLKLIINNIYIKFIRSKTYHKQSAHAKIYNKRGREVVLKIINIQWYIAYQSIYGSLFRFIGITMSGKPEAYTGVPVPTLLPWRENAWTKNWSGSGYFLPSGNKWFHDQDSPAIPRESLMFYNEEDWIKFKYMTENQSMAPKWSRDQCWLWADNYNLLHVYIKCC